MPAPRPRIPGILFVVALVIAAGISSGCKKEEREAIEAKCDASLRLRAEELAKSSPDSLLDVLGKAAGPVDDAQRGKLEKAGARLGTVTGDTFTSRVAVKKLGSVAALDFVMSLALSQTREPLGP